MKAFYTARTEGPTGKAMYSVWDYYLKRCVCIMVLENEKTNELYADRIAKALNETLHPEKKHD
jgi:hypothetical protein